MNEAAGKTMEIEVEGNTYEIRLFANDGKFYAAVEMPSFGEITVPDFGEGEARAIREIRGRIAVIARDAKPDESEASGEGD